MSVCGGVHEVDGDLGVLDAAGRSGVLALDSNGLGALLQIARLVDHEHSVGVVQVLDHVGAYVVTDRIRVPLRAVQQVLMPSGVASPACSARVQQFFRGRSDSSPETRCRTRRRGSTRVNRPAIRLIRPSKASCHRAGTTLTSEIAA